MADIVCQGRDSGKVRVMIVVEIFLKQGNRSDQDLTHKSAISGEPIDCYQTLVRDVKTPRTGARRTDACRDGSVTDGMETGRGAELFFA